MTNVVRVALPGYNALTDTDPRHFSLRSDEDNVLIKEKSRGTGTVASPNFATIPHNLGYIPFYMVFTEIASGRYRISNAYDPVGSGWRASSDTTNLYIYNRYSATYVNYQYYIFYDNMTTGTPGGVPLNPYSFSIARAGFNALTDKNPNHFIFHSDLNTFKIISEAKLSTQAVNANPTTFTVAHGQGKVPAVYALAKFPDGYVAMPGESDHALTSNYSRAFYVEVDSTNIYFIFYQGGSGNYNVDIKYYIFESPLISGSVDTPGVILNRPMVRVAKPGYNALTDKNLDHIIYDSNFDTLKYYQSDSVDVTVASADAEQTVTHSLGYIPFFVVFVDSFAGTDYSMCPGTFSDVGIHTYAEAYADATKIYFKVFTNSAVGTFNFRYKIFRNDTGL